MADSAPGGFDLQGLLAQAQQMQQQLVRAQEDLAAARVVGSSGGGLVTATVSGTGELLDLAIDREAFDPDDPEAVQTLADLVLAAVRDAAGNAREAAEETFGAAVPGGLPGGLPGMPGMPGMPGGQGGLPGLGLPGA